MAVTKFVRAQDILKEKGFKAPPFDTAGFQNAVVEFFQSHDISAKLQVIPLRFVELPDPPQSGFSMSEKVMLHAPDWHVYYERSTGVTVIEDNKAAKALEEIGGELETDDGRYYFFEYRNTGIERVYKGGHTDANGVTYAKDPVVFCGRAIRSQCGGFIEDGWLYRKPKAQMEWKQVSVLL